MMINKVQCTSYNGDKISPAQENQTTIDSMLEVYESVIGNNKVLYCSSPVTSGKRYFDWLEFIGKQFIDIDNIEISFRDDHFEKVVKPNRAYAQKIIQKLREQPGCIVVDPTIMPHLQGWTQKDWHSFWGRVLERYVKAAFFVNDWQYSNGCVYEFWFAYKQGIQVFSEDEQPLKLKAGIDLISDAISMMQRQKQSTIAIESILDKLKDLSND